MSGLPKVGVLLGQRSAYGRVCSGCPSNHKCVQFVFKTSLHHYINIQSCYFVHQIISPAILGMFQTVAVPQSQLRYCAVGAVRAVCEGESGFQKQFLALWCLHLGSLLHTGVPQPAKSQMAPLAWCPIADSEQSSRVTDRRAQCADLYNFCSEKSICVHVRWAQVAMGSGRGGRLDTDGPTTKPYPPPGLG